MSGSSVILNTRRRAGQLLLPANVTTAAFTARSPVAKVSLPTTGLVTMYDKNKLSGDVTNALRLALVGTGAAGNQPQALVIGWARVAETIDLYVPVPILKLTGTLGGGTAFALAGDATVRICDVLTPTASVGVEGSSGLAAIRQSDAEVDVAQVIVDAYDFEKIEIQVIKGTATKVNALIWRL